MKRIITILILALACAGASAQPGGHGYPGGPHHNSRYDYGGRYDLPVYWSVLGGWNFSRIASDGNTLDASGTRSGSYLGVGIGLQALPFAPVMFDTGLIYTTKGGKGSGTDCSLCYLELPIGFSYRAFLTPSCAVEPYLGAYLACGVGGKIKDYTTKTTVPSFSDSSFKRFDSGLRIGCGLSLLIFHAALYYDLGLTDISRDGFLSARNRCLSLALGLSF